MATTAPPAAPAAAQSAVHWLDTVLAKVWAFLKGLTHWATLLTGLQHAASAVYLSLRDWHIAVFWALVVALAFWFGTFRADEQWRPIADHLTTVNTTLVGQVRELKAKPIPLCMPVPCTPAGDAAPPATAPAPVQKAQPPTRKKKASAGFWGAF